LKTRKKSENPLFSLLKKNPKIHTQILKKNIQFQKNKKKSHNSLLYLSKKEKKEMEPNDSHQQQQHFTSYFSTTTTTTTTTTPSPTNGLLPPHQPTDSTTPTGPHMLYPHSMGPSTTATVVLLLLLSL
jgi:hypothetical protein